MTQPTSLHKPVLAVLTTVLLGLLLVSVFDRTIAQQLFLNTAYYFSMATVLCWVGTHLYAARDVGWNTILAWVKDNWPGLVIALLVTVVAAVAVPPALRLLSDEANLIGISKNLFASQSPTFTVSGKNYYGSYWDVDVVIDQRPILFPFLVSLVHSVVGYSYDNVYVFNLMVLPAFVLVSYRLAKSLGGEVFGVVASLLVVAHPIVLLTVRSGSFDFLTVFLALLVTKSLADFLVGRRPEQLAILWMNLCLFAGVRYETALFILPVVALLFLYKTVSLESLRPFGLLYVLTPAFLLPRIWLSMLRGNVPKQAPGTITFSVQHFLDNAVEYLQPILRPFSAFPAHSRVVMALGIVGCLVGALLLFRGTRSGGVEAPRRRLAAFIAVWMALQIVIVFSYVWGRAQYPSSARLVIPIDVFLSFVAAWVLARGLQRFRPFVPILVALGVLLTELPVAAQGRMMNRLTQTRESAATWAFFERLNEPRILIITDRPNHFTIMNYGAMSFEAARRDRYLLVAWQRRLFQDVYVIQPIKLSTNQPLPGYELWPDRQLEPVYEFQNDANVLVRVSRLAR